MDRIMIVGQPGSGKSTLARQLGARTGLPVIHTDQIQWLPGWIEQDRDERTRLCIEAANADRWIFEGGHSATWRQRISRADMLIWLDRPVALRLWRVLRRSVRGRGQTRPDLPDGCPERLRLLPEFLRYIWTIRHTAGAAIARLVASPPDGCAIVRLRSDQEVHDFVHHLSVAEASSARIADHG